MKILYRWFAWWIREKVKYAPGQPLDLIMSILSLCLELWNGFSKCVLIRSHPPHCHLEGCSWGGTRVNCWGHGFFLILSLFDFFPFNSQGWIYFEMLQKQLNSSNDILPLYSVENLQGVDIMSLFCSKEHSNCNEGAKSVWVFEIAWDVTNMGELIRNWKI